MTLRILVHNLQIANSNVARQTRSTEGLTHAIMPKLMEKLVRCTNAAASGARKAVPRALAAMTDPIKATLTCKHTRYISPVCHGN